MKKARDALLFFADLRGSLHEGSIQRLLRKDGFVPRSGLTYAEDG